MLVANPFLIDFFGLARGYGLAISLMMAGIYFIWRWLKTSKLINLLVFNICAMLATYSHFTLINFYVAAFLAINAVEYYKIKNAFGSLAVNYSKPILRLLIINGINILFMFITTLLLWEPLRKITKIHMFEYGGNKGLVSDTIYSLIVSSFYHVTVSYFWGMALSWVVAITILSIFIKWLYTMFRKRKSFLTESYMLIFLNCTLVVILLCSVIQHYILDNDYFIGRFALFLYPLFILNVCFSFRIIHNNFPKIVITVGNIFGIILLINFLYNANVKSYLDWEYDSDTKHMMNILEKHHDKYAMGQNIKLGITWYFEPTVNFYRITKKLDWLEPADREGLLKSDNYIYAEKNEVANFKTMRQQVLFSSEGGATLVYIK
ncbi:MAG: hypothetical protein P4L41_15760 [Flavipsychrobacter sp.]|nr:hypothetical protein [Flavipsychrobacter sp.]